MAAVSPGGAGARHERRGRANSLPPGAAAGLAGVPTRHRERHRLRPQPHRRDPPRGIVGGRRRDPLVGGAHAPARRRRSRPVHGRARLPVDVSTSTVRSRRCAKRPSSWPSTIGRPSMTPLPLAPATSPPRPPCTRRTCTSSGASRRRPRDGSGGCGPGSQTSTTTTACGSTASASWVACSTGARAGMIGGVWTRRS